jgi:hypothetical protein
MGEVTHQQVDLLLRLYDMRRETKLREARDWYGNNFHVKTPEDVMALCPPGSKENGYVRMVISYWDMACNIANRGLIDQEFFFENTGEQWMVWELMKPIVNQWRAMFSNPKFLAHLEENVKRLEAWREKTTPGSIEAMRKMFAQMQQMRQQPKAQVAGND